MYTVSTFKTDDAIGYTVNAIHTQNGLSNDNVFGHSLDTVIKTLSKYKSGKDEKNWGHVDYDLIYR